MIKKVIWRENSYINFFLLIFILIIISTYKEILKQNMTDQKLNLSTQNLFKLLNYVHFFEIFYQLYELRITEVTWVCLPSWQLNHDHYHHHHRCCMMLGPPNSSSSATFCTFISISKSPFTSMYKYLHLGTFTITFTVTITITTAQISFFFPFFTFRLALIFLLFHPSRFSFAFLLFKALL